jgi:hypothetical protein
VEIAQLVAWVFYTVGTVQNLSINTASSYIACAAISNLHLTNCQATMAIDIFSSAGVLKLLAPLFGNFGPGLVIVFPGGLIRWAFGTNETAVSHDFLLLHISSPLPIRGRLVN